MFIARATAAFHENLGRGECLRMSRVHRDDPPLQCADRAMSRSLLSPDEQAGELARGATAVLEPTELRAKLARGVPLIVKLGADPTAPDLHLGHSVVLRVLRRYQDFGHRVQFLIGD